MICESWRKSDNWNHMIPTQRPFYCFTFHLKVPLPLSLSISLPCLKMNILHVGLHNGSSALTILLFMWFWLTAASVAAQTPHHLAANALLLPDTDVSMSILKLAHFGPVWVSFSRLVQSVIVMVHVILHPLGTCNWKKKIFFSKRRKWMRKK